MAIRASATRGLSYYHCAGCNVTLASMYDEVLREGTAARRRRAENIPLGDEARWTAIRAKAEDWFRRLDDDDPYAILGLSPSASFSEVRARYHQLAGSCHPDRGGDAGDMRRVIEAYKQIRARQL